MPSPRSVPTRALEDHELHELRRLLDEAFEGTFAETDWACSLGGTHVVVEEDGVLLSHASVVPRALRVGDRALRTGYVEAVATRPGRQREGLATSAMEEVNRLIRAAYEIGALSTGVPLLYGRLGWELWHGPTFASSPTGTVRTEDDDGGIMVLRTPTTGPLDLQLPITCDWRAGDVW